jgi:hypothetical protein
LAGSVADLLKEDLLGIFATVGESLVEALHQEGLSNVREVRFGSLHGGFSSSVPGGADAGPGILDGVGWLIPEEMLRPLFDYSVEDLPVHGLPGTGFDVIERELGASVRWWFSPRRSVLSSIAVPQRPPLETLLSILDERDLWDIALSDDPSMRGIARILSDLTEVSGLNELVRSTSDQGFLLMMSGLRCLVPLAAQFRDSDTVDRWNNPESAHP